TGLPLVSANDEAFLSFSVLESHVHGLSVYLYDENLHYWLFVASRRLDQAGQWVPLFFSLPPQVKQKPQIRLWITGLSGKNNVKNYFAIDNIQIIAVGDLQAQAAPALDPAFPVVAETPPVVLSSSSVEVGADGVIVRVPTSRSEVVVVERTQKLGS